MSDFVICINNDSNPASLILGKVYRTLPDAEAEAHNMLRIIDEDKSEPDGYLYPAAMFAPIELPEVAKRVLDCGGRTEPKRQPCTREDAPTLAGADAVNRAAQFERVCRAWHRANGVQVPVPGVRGAEGEEKDKGVPRGDV